MRFPLSAPHYHTTPHSPSHAEAFRQAGSGVMPSSSQGVWRTVCFVTRGQRSDTRSSGSSDGRQDWHLWIGMLSENQICQFQEGPKPGSMLTLNSKNRNCIVVCFNTNNISVLHYWLFQWQIFVLYVKQTEQQRKEANSVFPITCLSIPGIRKKKYHSLCSATALVNNLSLGATSESPAWSPAWWVPCQFRRRGLRKGGRGGVERGKSEARKGGGGRRVWPKPALASSLEYYLLHTAWVSEWGWCLKVEVKSNVISTSCSLFCHPYLLHPSPFNVHYILNTLGRGTWCKNYAARYPWIWLVILALDLTARSLRISS